MAVGVAYVFLGFLTPVLTQISFQSQRQLFSHASAEVRGKNTQGKKSPQLGLEPPSHLGGAPKNVIFLQTNPPFYAPLVELIPSPWVDKDVLPKTKAVMEKIGQVPVILRKEIEGFVLNRIQYAIMKECWRLIKVC